jgi:hypothetical protein
MNDVVVKIKFSINRYPQIYNIAGSVYGQWAKFVITDQYAGFPREEYNFSFTDGEFDIVSSA